MSLPPRHNLPPQPTSLIGREAAQAQALALLRGGTRLLTLLGPGGVGKTRLAVALAEHLLPDYPGGAWFVDLSGETQPAALLAAVARILNLPPDSAATPASLAHSLGEVPRLLLLDNFESLPAAAPLLGELLGECPALRVLVTSRVPLNLRWERRLVLPPLDLPTSEADALLSGAVQLYLDRARAAGAPEGFDLGAVARLCARLDGLPLALELAAARAAQLGPEAMLARLERGPGLPGTPSPDRPARHQSLTAAIGASYELLDAGHQAVLRRLAVAAGGVTEDAARSVAATDGLKLDALDALLALCDTSLLTARSDLSGEPRFIMLETIRAYALAQAGDAELNQARARLTRWCLDLAADLTPRWRLDDGPAVLARLGAEQPNFRSALTWALGPASPPAQRQSGEALAQMLWPFWLARGYAAEGLSWLNTALERAGAATPLLLRGAGVLARQCGDLRVAVRRAEQASQLARQLADSRQEAAATGDLGAAWTQLGELERAADAFESQLNLALVLNDDQAVADALNNRGAVALRSGDLTRAAELLAQVLPLRRQFGDRRGEAEVSSNLGVLALQHGDWAQASALLSRSLDLRRDLGDLHAEAGALSNLGSARRLAGDAAGAAELLREALVLRRRLGDPIGVASTSLNLARALTDLGQWPEAAQLLAAQSGAPDKSGALLGLAHLAARQSQWSQAARCLGAAQAHSGRQPIWPAEERETQALTGSLRTALGALGLQAELDVGRRLTWDELLGGVSVVADAPPVSVAAPHRDDLSAREREVLSLLVNGWPNKKIAASLGLSGNTVKNHLAAVYSKLGVRGRAEAVARALQEKLVE